MQTFSGIETLAGVIRTIYNQYDSLVVPLQSWLQAQGVRFYMDCQVTDLDHKTKDDELIVTGIHTLRDGKHEKISVVVFTFEYSIRAAQMSVYQLLDIDRPIPPVAAYDKSLQVQFEALIKDMK